MKLSFSRIKTYLSCPKKYFYTYVEGIEAKPNEAMLMGTLFHEVLEEHYSKTRDMDRVFKEYEGYVNTGVIDKPKDLLISVYKEYISNYHKQMEDEKCIMNETKIVADWDKEKNHQVTGIVDKIVEYGGMTFLRDHKTTSGRLKYNENQVRYNQQQLLYVALVEDQLDITVDYIEIDEIRLEKLQPVPLLKGGKPTTAVRNLGLVTYEAYLRECESQGLDKDPKYSSVLLELKQRGHPLFRRTRVQLLDRNIVTSNLIDINDIVTAINTNEGKYPRHRSVLCDYCQFKELCNLDYTMPADYDREMLKNKLK